ncbi:ankyrin repeat domain-containing protein [Thermodesulfobacteriota bacterium]
MPKPEINAKEMLKNVREGMDDAAIMKKYRLSPKGLQSLFKKMVAAGVIHQKDLDKRSEEAKLDLEQVAQDVRAGADDAALTKKYRLTPKLLAQLYDNLLDAGLIQVEEFYSRQPVSTGPNAPQPDPEDAATKEIKRAEAAAEQARQDVKRLIKAAEQGRNDRVELFLDRGVDVNSKDDFGDTALIVASDRGHQQTVDLLLDRGAEVNATDGDGKTALHYAKMRGHAEVAELLTTLGGKD